MILNHLKKVYDKTPFVNLVFYEKVNFFVQFKMVNSAYVVDWADYTMPKEISCKSVWPYSVNIKSGVVIAVGVITNNWLLTDWYENSELTFNLTNPKNFDDHLIVVTKCCTSVSGTSDWMNYSRNLKKQAMETGIKTVLGLENRSSYERELSKGDYQLTLQEVTSRINDNILNFVSGSLEGLTVNTMRLETTAFNKHPEYLATHVWLDKNKDQLVDLKNEELTIEKIFDFNQRLDNRKRIFVCPLIYKPSNLDSFYTSIVNTGDFVPLSTYMRTDYIPLTFNYNTIWYEIVSSIISGESVGKAVFEGYYKCRAKYERKDITNQFPNLNAMLNTFFQIVVYGPPETKFKDLIKEPKIKFLPDGLNDQPVIQITNANFVKFTIQNIGIQKVDVNIIFDKSVISIDPISFNLDSQETKEIMVRVNNLKINDYGQFLLFSFKKKQTVVTIKYGINSKQILIKWFGI
jgi:hypothetical protein